MEEVPISDAVRSLVSDGAIEFLKDSDIAALAGGKRVRGDILMVDFNPPLRPSFLRVISPGALLLTLKAKETLLHNKIDQLQAAIGETGILKWGAGTLHGMVIRFSSEEELRQALENAKRAAESIASTLALISFCMPLNSESREMIPKDVRNDVWRRDQGRCVQCGSRERLEFDHVIPVAKGGANTSRNLQLLCENCNRSKSDSI